MRISGLLGLVLVCGGCSSTRYVMRDACWIRQTTGFAEGSQEELVACPAKAPAWSDDRVTRAIQECYAERENAFLHDTLRAERSGDPPPSRTQAQAAIEACRAGAVQLAQAENERLSALVAAGAAELERVRAQSGELTGALAEAAKKPASATATATADADGDARSDSGSSSQEPAAAALPPQRIVVPIRPATPARASARAPRKQACECPSPGTARARDAALSCEES